MFNKRLAAILAFAAVALAATPIYKWIDESGVVHYSDEPPPESEVEELELAPMPTEEAVSQAQERLETLLESQLGRSERLARAASIPTQAQIIGYWRSVNVGNIGQGGGGLLFPYQWYSYYEDGTSAVAMSSQPQNWGPDYLDANRERGEYAEYRLQNGLLHISEGAMRLVYIVRIFIEAIDEFERGDILMLLIDPEDAPPTSFYHLRRIEA